MSCLANARWSSDVRRPADIRAQSRKTSLVSLSTCMFRHVGSCSRGSELVGVKMQIVAEYSQIWFEAHKHWMRAIEFSCSQLYWTNHANGWTKNWVIDWSAAACWTYHCSADRQNHWCKHTRIDPRLCRSSCRRSDMDLSDRDCLKHKVLSTHDVHVVVYKKYKR